LLNRNTEVFRRRAAKARQRITSTARWKVAVLNHLGDTLIIRITGAHFPAK